MREKEREYFYTSCWKELLTSGNTTQAVPSTSGKDGEKQKRQDEKVYFMPIEILLTHIVLPDG